MPRTYFALRHMPALAAAISAVCMVVAVQANSLSSSARLQELADTAALAGVQALVSSDGGSDVERRDASIASARDVVARRANTVSEISPSVGIAQTSVSVRVHDTSMRKQANATARYVAPSAEAPSRQSSNMSLHSPSSGPM